MIVRACSFQYYKEYQVIGKAIEQLSNTEIYFECYNDKSKKGKIIDDIILRAMTSKTPKSILLNWYEIKLNGELRYSKKVGYKSEFKYIEAIKPYYSLGMLKIGNFDLGSKDKDKITIIVNLTVVSEGKEDTKTIEQTFEVKMKKLFWLEKKIYNILSV
jgi:hypothetical protein